MKHLKLEAKPLLDAPTYDPDHLLDFLIERYGLKNDAALAKGLRITPTHISKLRHRVLPVTAELVVRVHLVTNIPVTTIHEMIGMPEPDLIPLKRTKTR